MRREAWTRLLETSSEELADATREFLDPDQVAALKSRRDLLVEHFQALIDEKGEDAVLHEERRLGPPGQQHAAMRLNASS